VAGTRLSRNKVDFALSVSEFQFGLIIILTLFFVVSQLEQPAGYTVPVAISFVAFALLGYRFLTLSPERAGSGAGCETIG